MKPTYFRWTIVLLVFFASAINYIDRQVIGLLKPIIQDELQWSETDYSLIITVFNICYAVGMLLCGRLLDWIGTRIGYVVAICVWSIGAVMHAFMGGVGGFAAARGILGLGEAGNFPAAVKTIAEWFPKRDRALATGLFNSGTTIGAIVAPAIVASIVAMWGWRAAFVVTGSLGFIWAVLWLIFYRHPENHPAVNEAELAYIKSDNEEEAETNDGKATNNMETAEAADSLVAKNPENDTKKGSKRSWLSVFGYRQTYAMILSRFVTDWVWWFFLFWIPGFLMKTQGINLTEAVLPLCCIYLIADAGGIAGGWMASTLLHRGCSVTFARLATIFTFALLPLPLNIIPHIDGLWPIIILIGLAAACHQGWASNIFTIVSDIYPKRYIGTMTGISSIGGALGGACGATFVGFVLESTGSYQTIFMIASMMYLLAWAILLTIIRKIKPIE